MADANGNGSIQILVTPLGGASPSGHSAVEIRKQLRTALSGQNGVKVNVLPKIDVPAFTKAIQAQLSAGVKVNVTPVIANGAGGGKTATTTATNFANYDKATVSARAMTQQTALLTQQKMKLTQETHKENMAHQQNMHAQQQAAQAAKTAVEVGKQEVQDSKVRVQLKKEETAILNENAKQRRINTMETERANAAAVQEKTTIASMQMELAKFNQYLMTLNPKALTQFGAQINKIKTLLGSGIAAKSKEAAAEMKMFKAACVEAGYEGGNAMGMLFGKLKTYFSYFISSSVIMALYSGVSNLISNVKTLDEAMTDLRIVTGNTRKETDALLDSYNALAQKLGSTTADVASGATDWLRQGYTGDEAEELLTQSMTLSIVGDMESADATDALTAAIKGYGLAVEDASGIVDKFMTVDMAAATSSEDLALALAKTAANAKIAGLSLNDVIGQLAVVNETMKESGEETGSFYNTMLSRMGSIKSGRLEDPESGESLSDVETTLNRLGIALRDTDGDFRNFGEVLDDVGQKWDTYSAINQRAIAQSFAGTRQQTRFLSLMEGWAKAAEYSAEASNSAGKSAEKLAIYQESVEAKTARATAAFEKFSTSLLDSRIVGGVMDLGTGLLNALSALDGWPAKIVVVTAGIAGLYSALKSLGAMNIGKNFLGFFTALGAIPKTLSALGSAVTMLQATNFDDLFLDAMTGNVLNYNVAIQNLGMQMSVLSPAQIANIAVTNKLGKEHLEAALSVSALTEEQKEQVMTAYAAATATGTYSSATGVATTATGGLSAAVKGLWVTLTAHPIGALITTFAAVTAAVIFFKKKHDKTIQESIEKAEELQTAYKDIAADLEADAKTVANLSKEFAQLSQGVSDNGEKVALSADEYDRYVEIVNQLVDINPALVKGYTAEGQAIIDKNSAIQDTIDLLKEQQKLELFETTSAENNWAIAEGLSNAYDKALETVKDKQSELGEALRKAFIDGASYQVSDDGAIEDVLFNGRSRTEVYKELQKLFADFDYYETIVVGDQQVTDLQWNLLFNHIATASENTGAIIKDNIGYINSLLGTHVDSIADVSAALSQWTVANARAEAAATAYQSQMKLIAQTATGYDDLSAGSKQFLNSWIETWELTGDETEQSVENITAQIWAMVGQLNEMPQLQAALDVDYELLTGKVRSDFGSAVKELLDEMVASGGLSTDAALQIKVAMGITYVDPETGIAYDKHGWLQGQLFNELSTMADFQFDSSQIGALSVAELEYALTLDPSTYNSWEDFFAAIKAGASSATNSLTNFVALSDKLKAFEESFNKLSEALGEFIENGNISAETVADLIESFGDTDAMRDLINVLGDTDVTAEQVKEKLNSLGNEYLNSANLVALLDENTVGWVGTVLKSKGVVNGAEVALQQYKRMTVEADIATKNFTNSLLMNTSALEALGMKTEARGLVQLIRIFENIANTSTDPMQIAKAQEYVKKYTDQLNAMGSIWEDINFDWGTSITPDYGKDTDPWKEAFEKEYNAHKHMVEMEQETLADFYAWLDDANERYFANNEKYIDEYRKYAEEVFKGLRELAADMINDLEHHIFLMENQGGQEDKIIAAYRKIQTEAHAAAEAYRKAQLALGRSLADINNDPFVQEQQKIWWDADNAIKDLIETINDDLHDSLESLLDVTIEMIEKGYEEEIESLEKISDEYADIIDQRKEMLRLAERERQYNEEVEEKTSELAKLQARAASLQQAADTGDRQAALELGSVLEEINDLQKDLASTQREHFIETTEDALDNELEQFEDQQEKKIEAIEDYLDDQQALTAAALAKLDSMNEDLFEQLWEYVSKYTDMSRKEFEDMWNAALEAAKKYGSFTAALNASENGLAGTTSSMTTAQKVAQMKAYGSAWHQTADPNLKQAYADEALKIGNSISGASRDQNGVWWLGGKKLYEMSDAELAMYDNMDGAYTGASDVSKTVSELVRQMKAISASWSKDMTEKESNVLNAKNAQLAAQISRLLGRAVVFNNADGTWRLDHMYGDKLYDKYHSGGIVGGNGSLAQNELFALLQKRELVLNETQQGNLMAMLSQLKPLNALKDFFNMVRGNGASANTGATTVQVDASLHVDGTLSDKQVIDVIKKYPRKVAEVVSDQLGIKH